MMVTRSFLCPVVLTPFLMLINALHEFFCRFFLLFQLGLGFDHYCPSKGIEHDVYKMKGAPCEAPFFSYDSTDIMSIGAEGGI
jgi:hypothetical protein